MPPEKNPPAPPKGATGALALASGEVLWGKGIGAAGSAVGEVCFNTSLTGYQEVMTDPSYAGQIITFTFPHIGNVGAAIEALASYLQSGPRGADKAEVERMLNKLRQALN